MSFLQVSNVSRRGLDGLIVSNVTFQQRRSQKVAIAGETGSGKSTLLKMIAGLLEPDHGEIWFEGARVDGREALVPGHKDVAYLAQDFELPKSLRVEQVLEYARKQSPHELKRLYRICHIEHLLRRRTNELSGGERQRVAMARLLTRMPKLLLLDEPYTNLDRVHRLVLKQVLEEVARLGIALMMISHDPQELLSWSDTLIILRHGRIVQKGKPQHVYQTPRTAYVASLLGTYTAMNEHTPGFGDSLKRSNVSGTMYVRPEALRLAETGIPGRVAHVRFLGSHYEVEVSCPGVTVTVLDLFQRKVGDEVCVSWRSAGDAPFME